MNLLTMAAISLAAVAFQNCRVVLSADELFSRPVEADLVTSMLYERTTLPSGNGSTLQLTAKNNTVIATYQSRCYGLTYQVSRNISLAEFRSIANQVAGSEVHHISVMPPPPPDQTQAVSLVPPQDTVGLPYERIRSTLQVTESFSFVRNYVLAGTGARDGEALLVDGPAIEQSLLRVIQGFPIADRSCSRPNPTVTHLRYMEGAGYTPYDYPQLRELNIEYSTGIATYRRVCKDGSTQKSQISVSRSVLDEVIRLTKTSTTIVPKWTVADAGTFTLEMLSFPEAVTNGLTTPVVTRNTYSLSMGANKPFLSNGDAIIKLLGPLANQAGQGMKPCSLIKDY